jgi:hypothetical protein
MQLFAAGLYSRVQLFYTIFWQRFYTIECICSIQLSAAVLYDFVQLIIQLCVGDVHSIVLPEDTAIRPETFSSLSFVILLRF